MASRQRAKVILGARVVLAAGLALCLCGASTASRAQITGDLRTSFTTAFKNACVQRQRSEPNKHRLNDNLLGQYCACNAAFYADRVTEDDLTEAAKAVTSQARPSWLTDNAAAAADYCSRDISRYPNISA
jgi:hypothetical protein